MNLSSDQNLPPMKFSVEQEVSFRFNSTGPLLSGVIKVASFQHDAHSYDIYAKHNNTLYKHVAESDMFVEN